MGSPSHTDVVVALTGSSAALSGLVLVFLGVLIGTYQPLVGTTSERILSGYRTAAKWALAVFGVSLVSLVLDVSWLAAPGGHGFYLVTLVVFFVQLAALAGIAGYATVGVLLRG